MNDMVGRRRVSVEVYYAYAMTRRKAREHE